MSETRKLAVEICNHSGRHTAGDGSHDADRYGPCSQCLHYARVVTPILAARLADRDAAGVEALHAEHVREFPFMAGDDLCDPVAAKDCGNCQRWARYVRAALSGPADAPPSRRDRHVNGAWEQPAITKWAVPDFRSPEQRAMDEAAAPVMERVFELATRKFDAAITAIAPQLWQDEGDQA